MSVGPRVRLVAGAALAFAAFEITLRFVAYGVPVIDPNRGWVYRDTTVRHLLSEGHGISHWDREGHRESPFRPREPRIRFLAVGDSMTQALQVSDGEVYTARLEQALQEAGWSAAVVNGGRSSLCAADYVAAARLYRAALSPTWTIVQLRLDDLTTDCRVPSRTHFVEDDEGALSVEVIVPRLGRVSSWLYQMRRSSAFLDQAIGRASVFQAATRLPPMFRGGDVPSEPGRVRPATEYPIERELSMLASAWGGRLTIALTPEETAGPGEVEQRIIRYCTENGLSFVDLRDLFQRFERDQSSPYGFPNSEYAAGHLNPRGHQALASLILTELQALRARGLL